MQICPWFAAVLAAALVVVFPMPARAQLYEDVGTRAQGMSGAFVAVADDATATWWNPAGIATGALFSLVVEKGRVTQPETPSGFEPARRAGTSGFAVAFPSLGLSYYRLRVSEIRVVTAPTELMGEDRQALVGQLRSVRSVAVSQFGASVAQSLTDYLVVASTLKLVRGGAGSGVTDGSTDVLDVADDLDLTRRTHGDLDLGVMLKLQHLRAGLSVRNVRQPKFGEGSDEMALERQARAGFAIGGTPAGFAGLTVSGDADLTRTATAFGDVRHAAIGGEAWLAGKRLGVRGGLAANTIGARRQTWSTGVSVAATARFYIEAARTFGSDASIRGWSTTARFTF